MGESPSPWIDVNEIKRAVSIEQVLAHYGVLEKMKRRGANVRGLSPFRAETHASFFVNLDKGVWNDFPRPTVAGQEVPGNVVGLVMAFEQCDFRQALIKLHEMASPGAAPSVVTPPSRPALRAVSASTPSTPGPLAAETAEPTVESIKGVTLERVDAALVAMPPANEVFGRELRGLRYDVPELAKRGIAPERAKYWKVGYCSRGLMKGRLIVPIHNRAGELVAYIGRSLKNDDEDGKWKFPNGFRKSLELFGIDRVARDEETKEAVAKYGLILVEGVFDAIALIEKGFKNTVAAMGTDVSVEQRAMLVDPALNPTQKITVFFDRDEAGKNGRKKLAADLIYEGFVRYVNWERVAAGDRTDPDEMTKEELDALLRP